MKIWDSRQNGLLALRHDNYKAQGYLLHNRMSVLGVEIAGRLTTDREIGTYLLHEKPRLGDLNGATWWDNDKRSIPGWSFAWPSITVSGGGSGGGKDTTTTGNPDALTRKKGDVDTVVMIQPGGGDAKTPAGGSVLPLSHLAADDAFSAKTPHTLYETDKNLFPKLPQGFLGIVIAGSDANEQYDLFMTTDPRLIAPNAAGNPECGSLVCDLTADDKIDSARTAHLQGMFCVVKKPTGGPLPFGTYNPIAWNISMSGLGDTRGGLIKQGGVLACVGEDASGPLHVGLDNDTHMICKDGDGRPVNSAHIHTGAYYLDPFDASHDGPLKFEKEPYPDDVSAGKKKMKVHLVWKDDEPHTHLGNMKSGRWAWYAEAMVTSRDQPCIPQRPTTDTGGGSTTGGGRSNTNTPDTRTVDTGPSGFDTSTPPTWGEGEGPTSSDPSSPQDTGNANPPASDTRITPSIEGLTLIFGGDPNGGNYGPPSSGTPMETPPANTPGIRGEVFIPGEGVFGPDMPVQPGGWDDYLRQQTSTPAGGGGPGLTVAGCDIEMQMPAISITSQPHGAGLEDTIHNLNSDADTTQYPTTIRMEGFACQNSNGSNAYGGLGTTPEIKYTHRPCTGFAGGGTCDGGLAEFSPEMVMGDALFTFVSTDTDRPVLKTGVNVSLVYHTATPGVSWAVGIPDLGTGSVSSGYSWRVKSGALAWFSHDSGGAKLEAAHITAATQRLGFRSNTSYYGDLAHANTAARVWTFPDLTRYVALNQWSGGLIAQYAVPYGGADGSMMDGNRLTFDNTHTRLSIGIDGGGAAGILRFNAALSTHYIDIKPGATSADITYTLPVDPPAFSGYVLSATAAGVMSWIAPGGGGAPTNAQYLVLTADGTLTDERVFTPGTSLSYTDDGAGGHYHLNTVQDIQTTATPQWLRVGIGTTAHASATLQLFGGAVICPSADSTSAIALTKHDGATTVMMWDTTNKWVGVGCTPSCGFDIDTGYGYARLAGSGGTAEWDIDRHAAGDESDIRHSTAGTSNWKEGLAAGATDWHLYNFGLSANAIFVLYASNYCGFGVTAPTSRLDIDGDVEQATGQFHYWGDPTTDGSLRFYGDTGGSGTFYMQKRIGGVWTTKQSWSMA
jgi:hypothetical protein